MNKTKFDPDSDMPTSFDENFGIKMLSKLGWEESKIVGINPLSFQKEIYEIKPRIAGAAIGYLEAIERTKNEEAENETTLKNIIKYKTKVLVKSGKHKGMCCIIKEVKKDNECVVEINGLNLMIDLCDLGINEIETKIIPKTTNELFEMDKKGEQELTPDSPELFENVTNDKKKSKMSIVLKESHNDLKNEHGFVNQNLTFLSQKNDFCKIEINQNKIKWAIANLKVRIISKKYEKGKYYLKKGIILDTTSDMIILMLEDGEILENIKERYLETTIPNQNEQIMILEGDFKFQIGKVIKRNKNKDKIWIQIDGKSDLLEFSQEAVCDFNA